MRLRLAMALVVGWAVSCTGMASDAKLQVVVGKHDFAQGEPIVVGLRLVNTGDRELSLPNTLDAADHILSVRDEQGDDWPLCELVQRDRKWPQ